MRAGRRRMARGGRGADQARHDRRLPVRRLALHGRRRVPRALDRASAHPRHIVHPRRPPAGAALDRLGSARRVLVGSREYADDLRRARCRPQHRVPAVEHQQPARDPLGDCVVQGAARGGLASLGRGVGWRAADVRRRDCPGNRLFGSRTCSRCVPGSDRGAGRRSALGNDVHSLSQGVPNGDEPALLHHVLHHRRARDDGYPRGGLHGWCDAALA
jgi:hypothetical protein